MFNRIAALCYVFAITVVAGLSLAAITNAEDALVISDSGLRRVRSKHDFATTVALLRQDVAQKGIMFFEAVDQAKLAHDAGIELRPSTLLIFGNPPLGVQFLTANPDAGLDWPVRLLVREDDQGQVWAVYTDFTWIARRHHITNRDAAFKMASEVIASITAVASK